MAPTDKIILKIAQKHGLTRPASVASRYTPKPSLDLTPSNSGADFYEASVQSIKAALDEAFALGLEAGLSHKQA